MDQHFFLFELVFWLCNTIVIDEENPFLVYARMREDILSEITSLYEVAIFFRDPSLRSEHLPSRRERTIPILHESSEIESVSIGSEIVCLTQYLEKSCIPRSCEQHLRIRSEYEDFLLWMSHSREESSICS